MAELPNARIPDLPPAAGINPDDLFAKYNSVTGLTEHVKASEFIGNDSNAALYEWQSDYTYVLDEVSTHDGKWWQSLANDNIGNIPTEGAFWTQISKSSSGFVPYAAGIFTDTNVYVLQTLDGYLQLFRLLDATRPFVSSNFSLEYAQGKWELMSERGYLGVNKTTHGFAVSDVLTYKSGAWNKFSAGDRVLGIVKQVVDANHVIVLLTGSRVKAMTGLTAGATYYAQGDGTLGTTPTNGMVFVAISTTEAIILSGGGGPVIVQTTGSSTSDVMSQNAVTQAIQNAFLQIGEIAGNHDASTGLLPTTGTGIAGAIDSGDFWIVSVDGTIPGLTPNADLKVGDLIFAKIDNAAVAADFFSVPSFGYKKIQNQAGTNLTQQQILQFGSGMTAQAGTGKTIAKAGGNLSEDLIYDGTTAYGYALINLLYASISVDGNIDLNSNDGGEITIYTNDGSGSIATLQMTTTGLMLSMVTPGSQSQKIELAGDEIRFYIDNNIIGLFNTRGCFVAGGTSSSPAGTQNVTFGDYNENRGTFGATIIGELSKIAANCGAALISGEYCYVGAYGARAMGRGARAMGIYSFAGGFDSVGGVSGETNTKAPQTNGVGAFAWYGTDSSQVANDGANGDYSAILGGFNSHIPSTSPRSVVLGGSGLKARASAPDQVYVPSFNILTTPTTDNTLTSILARDPTTGLIKERTITSITGTGYTQGGNAFGAASILGLTDNFDLTLQTGTASLIFKAGGSDRARLLSNGKFLFNRTTALGSEMVGIQGSDTSTTPSLQLSNSNNLATFTFRNNSLLSFGTEGPGLSAAAGGATSTSGRGLFMSGGIGSQLTDGLTISMGAMSGTNYTYATLRLINVFEPTGASNPPNYVGIRLTPTLNQQSGSNGYTMAFDWNPTEQSIIGQRYGFLIRTAAYSGFGLGVTLPSAVIHIKATGNTTNEVFRVQDSGDVLRMTMFDRGDFRLLNSPAASTGRGAIELYSGLAGASLSCKLTYDAIVFNQVGAIYNNLTTSVGTPGLTIGNSSVYAHTSGSAEDVRLGSVFTINSGTGNYTLFRGVPTFNLTGGTHEVTFMDFDPTLNATTGLTLYGLKIRPATCHSGFGVASPTANIDIIGAGATNDFASLRMRGGQDVTTPNEGDMWHVTSNNRLRFYTNTQKYDVPLSDLTTGAAAAAAGTIRVRLNGVNYDLLHV